MTIYLSMLNVSSYSFIGSKKLFPFYMYNISDNSISLSFSVTVFFSLSCTDMISHLLDGGDIAYVRHMTPRDNTDGRNADHWARNRRSDDYELLCKNGRRAPLNSWSSCYLAKVCSLKIHIFPKTFYCITLEK